MKSKHGNPFRRLREFLALTAAGATLLLVLSACLSDNNLTPQGYVRPVGSVITSTLGTSTSTGAAADGARGSCALLEAETAERAYCVNCYGSLLTAYCPASATESSQCVDPNIRDQFQSLLNQCIASSVQRGFMCTRSCPAGSRIDLNSCACVPTSSLTGSSAVDRTDVGQTDSGPPLASLIWNYPSAIAQVTGSLSTSACTINASFPMAIRNRGNTVARANSFGTPEVMPTPTASTVGILGVAYIQSALAPAATTAFSGQMSGAYTHAATMRILTGGSQEISSTNSAVSITLTNRVLLKTYSDGGINRIFSSTGPFMGSADKWGNLYFTDPSAHVVVAVCFDTTGTGPHWCPLGTAPGNAVKIAGQWYQPGFTGHRGGVATQSLLKEPRGVAVDRYGNVYFSEAGQGLIRMICAGTRATTSVSYSVSGVCSDASFTTLFSTVAATPGSLHTIAGRIGIPSGVSTPLPFAAPNTAHDGLLSDSTLEVGNGKDYEKQGTFSSPYGIDVRTVGTRVNIYVADYGSHSIRAICTYNDGGPCAGRVEASANPGTGLWASYNNPRVQTLATSTNLSAENLDGTGKNIDSGGTSGIGDDVAFHPNTSGVGLLNRPIDIKMSPYGNLLVSDHGNHRLVGLCYTINQPDFCLNTSLRPGLTAGRLYTLVGSAGVPGVSTEGAASYTNPIYRPLSILLAKRYSDDFDTPVSSFYDNNILFTETESAVGSVPAAGFTTKIVCGGDSAAATGQCKAVCSANDCRKLMYTYAGQAGTPGDQNYGTGLAPRQMRFANPTGLVYDRMKSLIVSSTMSTLTAGRTNADWSLRLFTSSATTPVLGAKYSFTDSAQQTSFYCLRFQVETLCYGSGCSCTAIPALGGGLPVWYGATRDERCP